MVDVEKLSNPFRHNQYNERQLINDLRALVEELNKRLASLGEAIVEVPAPTEIDADLLNGLPGTSYQRTGYALLSQSLGWQNVATGAYAMQPDQDFYGFLTPDPGYYPDASWPIGRILTPGLYRVSLKLYKAAASAGSVYFGVNGYQSPIFVKTAVTPVDVTAEAWGYVFMEAGDWPCIYVDGAQRFLFLPSFTELSIQFMSPPLL